MVQLRDLEDLYIPQRAREYLQNVANMLKKYLKNRLISIIMFGSLVKGYFTKVSDADMMIIVSNQCTSKDIRYLNRLIMAYEIKYNYMVAPKGIISQILYSVDKSTGMFISHFICRRKDFLNGNFARTFQLNKLIATILAPNRIVFGSVLCRAKVLYGQDVINEANIPKISIIQLLKSILMNITTSLMALFIYPLTKRATLYEMESAKWSLLAAYYYVKYDSPPLPILLQFFLDRKISSNYIKRWIALRKTYRPDYRFGLSTPLNIIKIHIAVLKRR